MVVANQVQLQSAAVTATPPASSLTSLVNHLPGMAYRYVRDEDDWRLTFVSDGCRALTGRSPDDLSVDDGGAYAQLVHPEDRQVIGEAVQNLTVEQAAYNCVYRLLFPDNEVKWVRDQGTGVFSDAGELVLREGFILDISDEKQREGILIRSDEQAERLIQSIQDGVFLIQANALQFVNHTLAEMLGYTVEEVLGRDFRSFVVPEDLDGIPPFYRALRESTTAPIKYELRLRHRDGVTTIPVAVNIVMINYRGTGILGTVKDVSFPQRVRAARVQYLERIDRQNRTVIRLGKHPAVAEGRLNEALALIAEAASQTLSVARVGIWWLGPDGQVCCNQVTFEQGIGLLQEDMAFPVADYPASFSALREGLVLDVFDVASDPRTKAFAESYWRPRGIISALQAPILVHGEVIGLVCHGHIGPHREWTTDEVVFAGQIADLVTQTYLSADVRRRADELSAITRISREISAKLDLQQVLDSIAQHAAQLSNTDVGLVFALRQNGEIALAGYGLTNSTQQVFEGASNGLMWQGLVGRALVERRPLQVYDIADDKQLPLWDVARNEGLCSTLVVPLLKDADVIGGIILGHRQPRKFSQLEIEFVQALAQQSVHAVENARLLGLERSQREHAEALYSLAHSLTAFDCLPDLLRTVVDSVVVALNVHWAVLTTFDVAQRRILDCVTGGVGVDQCVSSFDVLWDGVTGMVWRSGVPVVSDANDTDEPTLVVPLQYQDEMLGTLTATRQVGQPAFSEQDVALLGAMANQTAAAMQSFRLLDSLNIEKIRLELLYRLGQHLAKTRDVFTICQLALDGVADALDAHKGVMLILDPETEKMQMATHVGFDSAATAKLESTYRIGMGLNGWVMENRQTVVLDDVAADSRWWMIPGVDDDMQSALSVPLLNGEVLVGVITLSSSQKAFFSEAHARLVESAAATIAVEVSNALLLRGAERRAREQACVSDIARVLNASSVDDAFPDLVQGLTQLVECEQTVLALWDEERQAFTVMKATLEQLAPGMPLTLPRAVHTLLMDGQPYLTGDPAELLGDATVGTTAVPKTCSYIVFPLSIGQQVIGLLCMTISPHFVPMQIPTLQQIADMVAIAVERDRLFKAEQRQREVAERLQETALVVNTLDLQEVLTLIMEQLESILPYQGGSIKILEQDAMRVIAARGAGAERYLGRRYELTLHRYDRRIASGEVVVIEDILENNEGFLADFGVQTLRSNIGVPLWVRDKVIGALTVDSDEPRAYSKEDIRVIRVFAQQAAIAIENARLFEEQRVQRELAEALREAAAMMTSVLDFDQVLDQILDQAARVVPGDTFNIILVEGDAGRMIRWRGYDELGIPSTPASRKNMPINYPSLTKMLRDGLPVYMGDVHRDPNWVPVPGREKLRSYVAAPIRVAGKTEGFLNVADMQPDRFGPLDAERLKAFADQAAIALQNARLFRQATQYAEELELRVRERTLQLEAKNAWLEAIVSSTSDGIIVTDSDGHIVDANRVAELYLYHSLPAEEVQCLRTAIRDLARRAQDRPDVLLEFTGLDLELRAAPILEQEGSAVPAVVVAVHDVSYLKALDRMKTQFVSNVSHELRTPITSIRLYSSLLQRNTSAQREQYFRALDQEAERLSKLVEDILRISRIEAGQIELERQKIDLNTLTEMAVLSHKALAESKELSITYEALHENVTISADPDKFIQVLNNLIENAINYTLDHGKVAVSVRKRVVEGRSWATVAVKDTGMGILKEEVEHIFERFFRGSGPQELRIQGSGLGLAIVKEIVQLHGGKVEVESEIGVGSTFTVWMPLIET